MPDGLACLPQTEIKGRLGQVHPDRRAFVKNRQNIRFGDINKLKIQDGLPMLAEHVTKKILFPEDEA